MSSVIGSLYARARSASNALWSRRADVEKQWIQLKGWSTLAAKYWRVMRPKVSMRRLSNPDSTEIVMLVVSHLRVDPRLEREARALAAAGYRVKIIFPDYCQPYYADEPFSWGEGITFRPLRWQAASYIMFAPWLFGDILHAAACEERPLAFHAHDLTTAMIGLSAAQKCKAMVVCDFHEWWSENVTWDKDADAWVPHPAREKRFFKAAEHLCMRRAHRVVTVCDSIARALNDEVRDRRPVTVIRNIPAFDTGAAGSSYDLRGDLGVGPDTGIVLYQGGVGPTRNLEDVIAAMAFVDDAVLVIRGPSIEAFEEGYLEHAARHGAEGRVVCLPPVPSADVVAAARGADVGLYTVLGLGLNFKYALPNKVFEYLAAGLPVLVPHFPEVRKLVEDYGVGLVFDPTSPEDIGKAINAVLHDEARRRTCVESIPAALRELDADREWHKLVELYDELRAEASG